MGEVIYGFPASGKTMLAAKHTNCLDLESSNFKWLFSEGEKKLGVEERKGALKRLNPAWPENYFRALEEARAKFDFVLISFAGIEYCKKMGIEYWRIFPDKGQKADYFSRMHERGNSKEFAKKMADKFDEYIDACTEDADAKKIVLKRGEFLEDALIKHLGLQ